MSSLPAATGSEVIDALERAGFTLARISGSHHILKREGHPNTLSVPVHGRKPLKRGTLRSIISDAGLTLDEFVELLD